MAKVFWALTLTGSVMGLLLGFLILFIASFCDAGPCDPEEVKRNNNQIREVFILSLSGTAASCMALKSSSTNNKKS